MAACAAGLGVHRLWEALPFPRFFEHALLALLALVAAWPLQRWLGWSRAAALSALWLLALCVFAGPVPMLAVAMLAAAAIAIGSLVMAGPVALVLGLALIAGTLGWLLPWPIHHRAVYALACIGLIAWRRTAIADAVLKDQYYGYRFVTITRHPQSLTVAPRSGVIFSVEAQGAPPLSYSIPSYLKGQIFIGDFVYSYYRTILLVIAILCVAGLWLLLQKTSFGRVVRAGVQNPDMVGALGISLQPYMAIVAGLGIGLAGLAGVLLAPIYAVHPAMGAEIITPAFVVVVIGGLGSFWGVVIAALLVGLVKGVMIAVGYSAGSTAAIYLLMLIVLLVRPRGLLGERIARFE